MGMFSQNLVELVNKKKGCKEGYEFRANPMNPLFGGPVGPRFGCFPKSQSTSTTTTTTTLDAGKMPPLSGVVTCGDGTKANPSLKEYCGDVNGINTKLKRELKEELPTAPPDSAPAPTLPSGQEALPTKQNNTQYYILYGVLGVAIIALLMRKNN